MNRINFAVNLMAVLAYVMFKVSSGTEKEVAKKLIEFEEVVQADIVFGEYDVIAKMMTKDHTRLVLRVLLNDPQAHMMIPLPIMTF